MRVSVIVPTKDEPKVHELTIGIHEVLGSIGHEIIIIDKSAVPLPVTNATVVKQQSNGLGRAVLEAFRYTTGDIIVTMNGDLSHDPRDLASIVSKIATYDIVVGSRFVSGARYSDTLLRKTVSYVFRSLTRSFLGLRVEDPLSGFWAVKRQVLVAIPLNPVGFKIVMELLFKAKDSAFTTVEIPITFSKRRAGRSKAGPKEAIRILLYMLKLRFSHARTSGRHEKPQLRQS